ncbi:MAG TPA: hypothetical protein EYN32_04300 [Phycisphaerales bacterium]|nr:hypothetical protein [Phycisphaerales bacterium]
MKFATLLYLLAISISITACQRTSMLGNPKFLPDNWVTAKSMDWQVASLPENNRIEFEVMQTRLIAERQGQYFSLFGKFHPNTFDYIQSTTRSLDEAYLNLRYSNAVIIGNISPDMNGLAETTSEHNAGIEAVDSENIRMSRDDLRRLFLRDKPSSLSPYPVVGN